MGSAVGERCLSFGVPARIDQVRHFPRFDMECLVPVERLPVLGLLPAGVGPRTWIEPIDTVC